MSTDSDLAFDEEKKNESPPFDFEVIKKCDSELSSKNDSSSENDEE